MRPRVHMPEITEIFVLKLKDPDHADPVRERARADFLGLEGVTSWRTYVTASRESPTLFAEVFTYPDAATAQQVTPEFAKRPATKAYLAEIEDMLVGRYFVEHQSHGETE